MTIDEAIKHCEEVADTPCFTDEEARCYSEHRQLAEWLKELKEYKEQSGDEELDFVPEHKKIPCTMIIGKPCGDAISRQAVAEILLKYAHTYEGKAFAEFLISQINNLPPVTPQHSDAEIQKIQEMEQAEIQKAYELGKAEMQPCEDAISRRAVMDCFKKWQPYMATRLWDFEQELSALPSVNPQQRSGQWIVTDDDLVYCSECEDSYYPRPIDASWYYCPHCGAKMVDPQESEE